MMMGQAILVNAQRVARMERSAIRDYHGCGPGLRQRARVRATRLLHPGYGSTDRYAALVTMAAVFFSNWHSERKKAGLVRARLKVLAT
jgi:hypothetical protein